MARAQAYHFGGPLDRASTLYRQVLKTDPANQGAQWLLASAPLDVEGGKAIEAGKAYFRRFDDDPVLHLWIALDEHLLGNAESAREHYEKATGLGRQQDVLPVVTGGALEAFLFGGLLYEQLGARDRAEEAWSVGVEMVKPRREAHPDNVRMRLLLASFYGLLGERASMLAEEKRGLQTADFSPPQVHVLAAVHAKRGDTERAVELLRRSLRQGLVDPTWEIYRRQAGAPLPKSEGFDQFLREFEAEERRLRAMY